MYDEWYRTDQYSWQWRVPLCMPIKSVQIMSIHFYSLTDQIQIDDSLLPASMHWTEVCVFYSNRFNSLINFMLFFSNAFLESSDLFDRLILLHLNSIKINQRCAQFTQFFFHADFFQSCLIVIQKQNKNINNNLMIRCNAMHCPKFICNMNHLMNLETKTTQFDEVFY